MTKEKTMNDEKFFEVAKRIVEIINSMFPCKISFKGHEGVWWSPDDNEYLLWMSSGPNIDDWRYTLTENKTNSLYEIIDTPQFYFSIYPIVESVFQFIYRHYAGYNIATLKTRELYDNIEEKRKEMKDQLAKEIDHLILAKQEPLNEELDVLD